MEILEIITRDEDKYVRRDVARHPNTPVAVLKLLARDEHDSVRCCVPKKSRFLL